METGRLEKQPTYGALRWYAASICRVSSHRLEERGEKPTDENIREYVRYVWADPKQMKQLQHSAAVLRSLEIEEAAKKYPDSVHPDVKAQLKLIDSYKFAMIDAIALVGDIIFQGEGALDVERR